MGAGTPGFAGPSSPEVQDALRLRLDWHDGGGEGPGQMRALIAACLAVGAGLARHVLVYRTVSEATAQGSGGRQGIGGGGGGGGGGVPRFSGFLQWTLPFGAVSAVNWLALVAERRMHEFSLTREQLGQIALNGRRNAALNPSAIYSDPMDLADYLGARMISTPLCLFDCDAPCDGSTAFVVSHRDYAPDAPRQACHVNAVGTALRGRASWDQFDDPTSMAARGRGRLDVGADRSPAPRTSTWPSSTTASPSWPWCGWRRWASAAGARADRSWRTAPPSRASGVLPLNTAGGQLSGGRLHGFGLIHEACVQLRGEGGERQVRRRAGLAPRGGRREQRGRAHRRDAAAHPRRRAERDRPGRPGQVIRWAARAARAARVRVGP